METLLIFGIIVIITGIVLRLTFKNRINFIFGYRTKDTLKNVSIWNLANKAFSKYFIILGIVVIVANITARYVICINYQYNFVIFIYIIGLIISIIKVEKIIKTYNEKNNF